jgi:hypothetical protein
MTELQNKIDTIKLENRYYNEQFNSIIIYQNKINTYDEYNHHIIINIKLCKINNIEWTIDIYDSKYRHFYTKINDNNLSFNYYHNKSINNELNIFYNIVDNYILVNIIVKNNKLDNNYKISIKEVIDYKDNLYLLEKELNKYKNIISELNSYKSNILNLYPTYLLNYETDDFKNSYSIYNENCDKCKEIIESKWVI